MQLFLFWHLGIIRILLEKAPNIWKWIVLSFSLLVSAQKTHFSFRQLILLLCLPLRKHEMTFVPDCFILNHSLP